MSNLRPRLCVLKKEAGGYGFHLHGERGKTGQFIRLVEPDTPASAAGLLAGDRLVFVDGENVEGESHQQVVARIRATVGPLELIVVDPATAELLLKHNLQCRKEFVFEGIPLPGDSDSDHGDAQSNGSPVPRENGDASSDRSDRSERLSVSSIIKNECQFFFMVNHEKKAELALPLDDSEDDKGFSDEENELLETQQSESDEDIEMDEDYKPENEDSGDSEDRDSEGRDSEEREDSEGESEVTGPPLPQETLKAKGLVWKKSRSILPVPQWKGSVLKAFISHDSIQDSIQFKIQEALFIPREIAVQQLQYKVEKKYE